METGVKYRLLHRQERNQKFVGFHPTVCWIKCAGSSQPVKIAIKSSLAGSMIPEVMKSIPYKKVKLKRWRYSGWLKEKIMSKLNIQENNPESVTALLRENPWFSISQATVGSNKETAEIKARNNNKRKNNAPKIFPN